MRSFDYAIIGNSAAAISAVEAIRSLDSTGTIAIVDREDGAAYSTPMISYLLKGKIDEQKMPIRDSGFYDRNAVECIFGNAAVSIDPDAHTVGLSDGESIGYGKLLVACGSVPADPPVAGMEGANVLPFLNLSDAHALQQAVEQARQERAGKPVRVAVIGSGLIGCKACEGLAAISDEVVMLARSPEILRSVLDAAASPIAERALDRGGVEVRLSTQATAFDKVGDKIVSLTLNDGSSLDCDIVVLAAGVKPNAAIAQNAGAMVDGGLVCDEHMRTSLPDVYAAGDVAVSHDIIENRDKLISLWPNAVKQGTEAGLSMAGSDQTLAGSFPMNSITLFGTSILSAGVKSAGEGMLQSSRLDGDVFTKFITKDGVLVGFMVVNRPESAGIYTRLIEERIPLEDVDEDIFTREPQMFDLPFDVRWPSMHEGLAEGGN